MRELNELLKLEYSEMSAEEIEAVIEFKALEKSNEAERIQREATLKAGIEKMQEEAYKAREEANKAFKYACSITPNFKAVNYGEE